MRRVIILDNVRGTADRRVEPATANEDRCASPAGTVVDAGKLWASRENCEKAVRRAYWNMIELGHGHFRAFRIADRVFQWHLPNTSDFARQVRISRWTRTPPAV